MNWIDIILAIPLLIGLAVGIYKGILKTIGTLIGLFLSILLAYCFADNLTAFVESCFAVSSNQSYVLSFALIFITTFILCVIVVKIIEKFLEAVTLGWANRLAGGLFGVLKYALLLSVLINLVDAVDSRFHFIPSQQKESSFLYKPVKAVVPTIMPYVHFYLDSENERTK